MNTLPKDNHSAPKDSERVPAPVSTPGKVSFPGGDADDLFIAAMALNRRKFETGHLDDAYHALSAALHLGEIMGSENRLLLGSENALRTVARVASEQLAWIDAHAPEYQHSSVATRARGNKAGSIWQTLATMASIQGGVWSAERLAHVAVETRDTQPKHP